MKFTSLSKVFFLIGTSTSIMSCGVSVTDSPEKEATPAPRVTATPVVTPTPEATPTPTITPTPTVTATPAATPTPIVTPTLVPIPVDTTAPVVTIIGEAAVTIEAGMAQYAELGASALDDYDGDIAAMISSTVNDDIPGSYSVTYTATDTAGNTATAIRIVNVVDTTAPIISLNGEDTIVHNFSDEYIDQGATAIDNIDNVIPVTNNSAEIINTNEINSYLVTYSAIDQPGNQSYATRTVYVDDIEAPVITLIGGNTTLLELGNDYQELGAVATDNFDGELIVDAPSGSVDKDTLGNYQLTYTVTDAANNTSEVIRTVSVVALATCDNGSPDYPTCADSTCPNGGWGDECLDPTLPQFKVEADFFTDSSVLVTNDRRRTLTNVNGNDSGALNSLISQLNSEGGGIINIPAGTWQFGGIILRSNIHLFIDPDAVITFYRAESNGRMFNIGNNGLAQVQNVSIRSTSDTEKFTIDLSGLNEPYPVYPLTNDAQTRQEPRVMPFRVSDVDNFMISGVHVKDKLTIHSSVNFIPSTRAGLSGGAAYKGAINGVVKDIVVENAHGGYGAVQTRVGSNILFKNINSLSGGTTLRIETDAPHASGTPQGSDEYRAPIETMIVDNIFAYNIGCTNGNAAVMVQPWYADNGLFDVQKIESTSCAATVRIDRAFVNWQQNIGSLNNPEHPVGTFDSQSRVSEIKATYGTNAQVKQGFMRFIPSSLCNVYNADEILMETFHQGPAISPLVYWASSDIYSDDRLYSIRVPNEGDIEMVNFPNVSRTITRAEHYSAWCN